MSIVAMMAGAASEAVAPRRTRGRRRTRGGEDRSAAEIAGALTRYIPTEAVALYTAILPFLVVDDVPLNRQDYTSRWWLAVGVGIAAVLFGVGIYKREIEARGREFKWPPRRTVTVVAAYTAWVCVIPGSPFNSFGWYTTSLGAIVGIVAGAGISLFHLWFGMPEEADTRVSH